MRGSEAITYLRTEAIFSVKGTVRIRNKCGVNVEFSGFVRTVLQ